MFKNRKWFILLSGIAIVAVMASSCKSHVQSNTTGWDYNNPENGGFEVASSANQITGPGLVLVEGGTFTMGATTETPFLRMG